MCNYAFFLKENLMTQANKYYKDKFNINSYDEKYLGGKSFYDDLFDKSFDISFQ